MTPAAAPSGERIRVSLVAVSDSLTGPVNGLFEVFNVFPLLSAFDPGVPARSPFRVEIVTPTEAPVIGASGLPIGTGRAIGGVSDTDIVIVPSMYAERGEWRCGRHPEVVAWLAAMHARGAMLCSACSGVLLLAETGLLDGHEATIHWAFAPSFRRSFPDVRLRLEKVLVASGSRGEFVMTGASASWHDLALYLVARFVGPAVAQSMSKFLMLDWHIDGQAPYMTFQAPTDHGDAVILDAQTWLATHFSVACPVEEMVKRSGVPERSFKRRFTRATGYAPIAYVQYLRVEEARRRLERTDAPVEDIAWAVGYEDPAAFRRLFKRTTGMAPGAYRRKFRLPALDLPAGGRTHATAA